MVKLAIQLVSLRRRETYSERHPFARLAKAYQGRIVAARWRLEEAERLMKDTLRAALLASGDDHFRFPAGKRCEGVLLTQGGKLVDQVERHLRKFGDQARGKRKRRQP
ncbi:hypothetical protein PG993_006529 [Apiospora rasikravindrae]|uniref:Transposase n=1 Tax=Apiospora rasikravindrae TaxID=990691 RepID=A0ABR1T7L2_9PEZI